jgi:hypothetical protein
MSVGSAKLELTKGNEMEYKELVDVVKAKFDFTDEGALVFVLSLTWSLADDKLKERVVLATERSMADDVL